MKTLKEAKVGETLTVKKLHGEGACKAPYHGYGSYKGRRGLCKKSCATRRSYRAYGPRI